MKKTQDIHIISIGTFHIYPIKPQEKDYNKVDIYKNILTKKELQKGTQAKYTYIDNTGKEYEPKDVFTDFNGIIIQGIKRTENVKKFEVVDRTDIYNLTEFDISLLDADKTTLLIFDKEIGNKAIKFTLKKSSVGFNFWRAYISKLNNQLVLISGKGDLTKAISEFNILLANKQNSENEIKIDKVEVNADEIEIEV